MGIVTFAILTIHTTLPLPRSRTVLMALLTSFLHFILVIRTHRVSASASHLDHMEFKLKVEWKSILRLEIAKQTYLVSFRSSLSRCSTLHAMCLVCVIVTWLMLIRRKPIRIPCAVSKLDSDWNGKRNNKKHWFSAWFQLISVGNASI